MDNNLNAKEVQPTDIPPGTDSPDVTCDDVLDTILQYIDNIDLQYEEQHLYNQGSIKGMASSLSLHRMIQSINTLMYDYITSTTPNRTVQQSVILSEYFNGVNSLSKILDNIDIKVADHRIVCYILGYMIKLLTKFKGEQPPS